MARAATRVARVARALALATTAASLAGGCTPRESRDAEIANGDDPIAALAADVESTRYGTAYWTQQSDSNTSTWQRAKLYCGQSGVTPRGQKINCAPVMAAKYEETARHPDRRPPDALRP